MVSLILADTDWNAKLKPGTLAALGAESVLRTTPTNAGKIHLEKCRKSSFGALPKSQSGDGYASPSSPPIESRSPRSGRLSSYLQRAARKTTRLTATDVGCFLTPKPMSPFGLRVFWAGLTARLSHRRSAIRQSRPINQNISYYSPPTSVNILNNP